MGWKIITTPFACNSVPLSHHFSDTSPFKTTGISWLNRSWRHNLWCEQYWRYNLVIQLPPCSNEWEAILVVFKVHIVHMNTLGLLVAHLVVCIRAKPIKLLPLSLLFNTFPCSYGSIPHQYKHRLCHHPMHVCYALAPLITRDLSLGFSRAMDRYVSHIGK